MAKTPSNQAGVYRVRALLLLLGAVSLAVLGAWARFITRGPGGLVLSEDQRVLGHVPMWLAGLVVVGAMLGAVGLVVTLWRDEVVHGAMKWVLTWVKGHPWWSVLLVMGVMLGAVDGYEILYDPFGKRWGPFVYRARDDVQMWLWFGAAVLGGLGVVNGLGAARWNTWLSAWLEAITGRCSRLAWVKAVVTPMALAAAMCWFALDGIPHFSDALTYLMQGRILYSGSLWLPSPAYPELFIHSLFFLETDGRFYGKYPIGWPTIVGAFDHLNLLFMANATLAGLAAILTGLVARELAGKRVAVISALVFGLSPWVWFHGASFASHVASTCAVWGFLWLFLVSWRLGKWSSGEEMKWPSGRVIEWSSAESDLKTPSPPPSPGGRGGGIVVEWSSAEEGKWPSGPVAQWPSAESDLKTPSPSPSPEGRGDKSIHRWYVALLWALGAGLVLGCAVLIRPGDATNFALPAIMVVMIGLVQAPKKWLPMGLLISVGAMVGVLIYLWSNAQTTGDAFTSPYKLEPRWKEDWQPTIGSMLGRFAFQWAELTGRFPGWGVGGLTLALMGLMVVVQRGRQKLIHRGAWGMVLAAVGIFFVFNTTFGFTNVWWGPRWLLPVAPLVAILIGVLVDALMNILAIQKQPHPHPYPLPEGEGAIQSTRGGTQPPIHSDDSAFTNEKSSTAGLLLAIIMAGLVLVGPTMYVSKFWEVRVHPPHGVNGEVHRRVTAMGLKDAVVGMSTAGGLFPPDARSGMVMMTVPFEGNPVIYVRTISDWQTKAKASFPGRHLYEIVADNNDTSGFIIKELTHESQ